jgi:hypothetical protein
MRTLILISLSVLIAGCAKPAVNSNDAKAIAGAQPIERTTWTPMSWHLSQQSAPVQGAATNSATGDVLMMHYGSIGEGPSPYWLNILAVPDDWAFYESAFDAEGNELNFSQIDRDIQYNSVKESFGINFSREYLESAQTKGLTIRAVGQGGSKVFELSPEYIKSFLGDVDQHLYEVEIAQKNGKQSH